MNEIKSFFQDIFMMKPQDNIKVGLSQFKPVMPVENPTAPKSSSEIKLSDLMRGGGLEV
jgi:hypothetical protein